MSPRLQRYLIYTPASAIATFLVFCSAAIVLYPGCTIEVIGYTSNQYSFTHNFLSALGSMQSNTDNINLDIPRLDNTPSMLLFNSAMVFIGFSVSIFYVHFHKLFVEIRDCDKAIKLATYTKPLGIVAGLCYAGVGLVPHDLHFGLHVLMAYSAFSMLLVVCMLHAATLFKSEKINNWYGLGYVMFCVFLAAYLLIIFVGPKIGPGLSYTEDQLVLQVVAQKSIVICFISAMLVQVYGLKKLSESASTVID
jgi:hypothetical membrane protein